MPKHLKLALLALPLLGLGLLTAASSAEEPFHSARCVRTGSLVSWRCSVVCADGSEGIGLCEVHSEWSRCGLEAIRELCSAQVDHVALCRHRAMLADGDSGFLAQECDRSFGGFDEEMAQVPEAERFPGLVTRPTSSGD